MLIHATSLTTVASRNDGKWDFSAVRQRCVERRVLSGADIRCSPGIPSITAEAGPLPDGPVAGEVWQIVALQFTVPSWVERRRDQSVGNPANSERPTSCTAVPSESVLLSGNTVQHLNDRVGGDVCAVLVRHSAGDLLGNRVVARVA